MKRRWIFLLLMLFALIQPAFAAHAYRVRAAGTHHSNFHHAGYHSYSYSHHHVVHAHAANMHHRTYHHGNTRTKITTPKKTVRHAANLRHPKNIPVTQLPTIQPNRRFAMKHWHNPHLINHSIALANATSQHLVSLVRETVQTLKYSAYKLGGTYFNANKGVYEVDCSTYVDQVLHQADPRAYISLVDISHKDKPTSLDYYNLFTNLPNKAWDNWQKIPTVTALAPGDILVFRYKNLAGKRAAGHVMVVMDKPTPAANDTYLVRVADSAPAGHSFDTRPLHHSGIGIGTLLLKVNPNTEQPYAYAWNLKAPLENDMDYAMAMPIIS